MSTRQRANGRPGEISMCTCTSTRTDISPLACTTENAAEISAAWNLPPSVEIQLNRWFHYAGSPPGGPPIQACPWPAAAPEQPGFREAQATLRSEDEMVVDWNVQETADVDELPVARTSHGRGG